MVMEKKSLILVMTVMVKEKNKRPKKISVTIPKGVDDGTRIRLAGKGEAGSRGGATGDLYLFINVYSHDLFKRSDENLFFEFPLSLADACIRNYY
jgi:molecular chaperone DnaJ